MEKVLIHHGILGQKWGKKNGPPYPLAYGAHTAEQKKRNNKSVIDPIKNDEKKYSKKERKQEAKKNTKSVKRLG